MDLTSHRASPSERSAILAHYDRTAPLIARNFRGVPLMFSYYPHGLGTEPTFSSNHDALPHTVPHVQATTTSGKHAYPGCAINTILYYVHKGAVGVHSWTPTPADPDAVGYARLLLKPVGGASQLQMRDALRAFRAVLLDHDVQAVPLFEGTDAALFIPFADSPPYEPVRAWLHRLIDAVMAKEPRLICTQAKPHEQRTQSLIEATCASNAPGHHSRLPYTLTGEPDLPMVTPFDWSELDSLPNGSVTAANAGERLKTEDPFATFVARIGPQHFAKAAS